MYNDYTRRGTIFFPEHYTYLLLMIIIHRLNYFNIMLSQSIQWNPFFICCIWMFSIRRPVGFSIQIVFRCSLIRFLHLLSARMGDTFVNMKTKIPSMNHRCITIFGSFLFLFFLSLSQKFVFREKNINK